MFASDCGDCREADARFRAILDRVPEGVITIDESGRIESVNAAAVRMFGYATEELIGHNVNILLPDSLPGVHDDFLACYNTGRDFPNPCLCELQGRRKDGTTFPIDISIGSMQTPERQRQFVGIVRDVTARKAAEAGVAKLSRALEQTADSILISDRNGCVEYVNAGFEHTTGFGRDEVVGQTPRLLKSGLMGDAFYRRLWETILSGRPFRDVFINTKKDGTLYYEEKTITPLMDDAGEITHFVSSGKDVTERERSHEHYQFLAYHDPLTGIPNRTLFMEQLAHAVSEAGRRRTRFAVLFIDLDNFKTINDRFGHAAGDNLLRTAAQRLRALLRREDTVARLGGDEFAILLRTFAALEDVSVVARKILDQLTAPYGGGIGNTPVSASLGIALSPDDGTEPEALLKRADAAMYQAKTDKGRDGFRFYAPDTNARAQNRIDLDAALCHALAHDQFRLYYQPQVHAASGRLAGVEALLRWERPGMGLLLPGLFISALERSGLITGVGKWVLDEACRQLRAWRNAGLNVPRIAVNVAPSQLIEPRFKTVIEDVLQRASLAPNALELEITERTLIEDDDRAAATLHELSAIGVGIAMDDFGTGYSCLSRLRRLPIKALKIDREFVTRAPREREDREIVRAIIAMAHSLRLSVIAEGVETEEQQRFLCDHGCHSLQGFLFTTPLPADELGNYLSAYGCEP